MRTVLGAGERKKRVLLIENWVISNIFQYFLMCSKKNIKNLT